MSGSASTVLSGGTTVLLLLPLRFGSQEWRPSSSACASFAWAPIPPVPHDPARVVGQLVLEGMNQVVQYTGRVTHATMEAGDTTDSDDRSSSGEEGDGQDRKLVSDKNKRGVAVFQWFDFPILDNSGAFEVKTHMAIFIDLNTQRMCKASLDDEPLTATEAMPQRR